MQKILSRVIFIGFGIQIVLGILWMCNAFIGLGDPIEGIVCVGSMALTGGAVFLAKQSIWGKGTVWQDGFVVLSVLTFPFMMQCLMNPDYRLIIAVVMLLGTGCVLRVMRKVKKLKLIMAIFTFFVLEAGVIIGAESLNHGFTPLSVRMSERIVWTTLYKSYTRLPDEVCDIISHDKIGDSTHEVLGMRTILVPSLIDELGEEQADEILSQLRALSWQYEKKQVIKEIAWDAAGYTLSPIVLQLQLEGRAYESYSGMNYRELLQGNPELGELYTKYSCWWFWVALILGSLICGENWIKRKIQISGRELFVVVVAELGMIIWYTMDGAGRMDYKNTLFVLCIWLIMTSGASVWSLAEEQSMRQLGGNQDEKG